MNRGMLLGLLLIVASRAGAQAGAPPAPTDVRVIQSPGSVPGVVISWAAGESSRLFRIYRSVGDTNHFALLGYSPIRLFADFDVVPSITYAYAVTAVDTMMQESPRSMSATLTITGPSSGSSGSIAGTVSDDSSGLGIPDVRVRFFSMADSIPWMHSALTDSLGRYIASLDSGPYLIHAGPLLITASQPYVAQWYEEAVTPMTATEISVSTGDTTVVDFRLKKIHRGPTVVVHGLVTDNNGVPIAGSFVTFCRSIQELQSLYVQTGSIPGLGAEVRSIPAFGHMEGVLWTGLTNGQGSYTAELEEGKTYVALASQDGYQPTYSGGTSDPTIAMNVSAPADSSTINFSLPKTSAHPGSVQGTTLGPGGQAITSRVILFPRPRSNGDAGVRSVATNTAGEYAIDNILPGMYSLLAIPYSGCAPGYFKQGYGSVPHWEDSDSIPASGSVLEASLALQPVTSTGLSTIQGTITSNGNNLPLPGVILSIRALDRTVLGWSLSDATGKYEIDLMNSGPAMASVDRPGYHGLESPLTVMPGPSIHVADFSLNPTDIVSVLQPRVFPEALRLYQNYPNPFNPTTVIRYELPVAGHVRLVVYDLLGREVKILVDEKQDRGAHRTVLDAAGYPTGTYFYRLTIGSFQSTKAMTVLR
ncbi:MAG: T9SS type A sorting domain-containing protein [Bacteroidota bacterium]